MEEYLPASFLDVFFDSLAHNVSFTGIGYAYRARILAFP